MTDTDIVLFWTGLITLTVVIAELVFTGLIFKKAGKKWWYAFIPLYSDYTMYEIVYGSGYMMFIWFFLEMFSQREDAVGTLVAMVLFLYTSLTSWKLAKAFGKSTAFAIGLIFLPVIFLGIMALDDSCYKGVLRDGTSFDELYSHVCDFFNRKRRSE